MKKKLCLLFVLTVLSLTVLAGCGNKKDNGNRQDESGTGNGQATEQQTSSENDANQNTSTNGANNTESDLNNNNGHSEGVLDELGTDIGNGIEDLGNGIENIGDDLSGDPNSNVNDVTSGR